MRVACLSPLLSVVAVAGCQRSTPSADLSPADIAAIRATSERWVTATRAGRWDDAAATYTEDAVLWFPNAAYVGRAAIHKYFETLPPFNTSRILHIDEIRGRGDMAFVSGHSTMTSDSGAPVVVARYLDVRLRQADGNWLYYRDMVTPVARPAAAQQAVAADKRK